MTPLNTLMVMWLLIVIFIVGRKAPGRRWRKHRMMSIALGIIAFGMLIVMSRVFTPPPPAWADELIVTASRDNWRVHLIVSNDTPVKTPLTTITVGWHMPSGMVAPAPMTYRLSSPTTRWEATWTEPMVSRDKSAAQYNLALARIIVTLHGPGHTQTIVQPLGIGGQVRPIPPGLHLSYSHKS